MLVCKCVKVNLVPYPVVSHRVRAGIGVSFMSNHGLRTASRSGNLKRLPVTGLHLERPIFLVRHAE